MTAVEEDFGKQAAIEHIERLILLQLRSEPFLRTTRIPEWMTLGEIVSRLDEASYWTGEGWTDLSEPEDPPENDAAKRRHVREMVEWLWSVRDQDESLPSNNVFLSRFAVTDNLEDDLENGGFERVFKQASLCSVGELEDLADDKGAFRDFNSRRLDDLREGAGKVEAGGSFNLTNFYVQELSEGTMKAAWPTLDHHGREWVVAVAVKLSIAQTEMLREMKETWNTNSPTTSEEAHERIGRGIEGVWDGLVRDFADKYGVSLEEAERFIRQDAIKIFSSEFAEVLESFQNDGFGWTLDEHLRFAVEERGL